MLNCPDRQNCPTVSDHAAHEFKAGLNLVGCQKLATASESFQCVSYVLVVLEIHAKKRFDFLTYKI